MAQAVALGADVRGYFYWSLLDNFEWTGWLCGISLTPDGIFTRMRYGPGRDGSPTMTARRTEGGKAGNGFLSMSSGSTDSKPTGPG